MPKTPYLYQLTERLSESLAEFPAEFRERHSSYLKSKQTDVGGFPHREGEDDLYYTGFALRGLACLDRVDSTTAKRAGSYLRGCMQKEASIVDFISLLYSVKVVRDAGGPDLLKSNFPNCSDRVLSVLEAYRKDDGGYAKATEGHSGSTYHTFLVALCYQMVDRELPERDRVLEFLLSRRREDGGFVEVKPALRGGTNPTAAAIALLLLLDADEPEVISGAVNFMIEMQNPEGGLKANARTPLADLLSTFTGLLTLTDIGEKSRFDLDGMQKFVESLEVPTGGFRGGVWDSDTDSEYTFYGLGTLALLRRNQDGAGPA